MIYFLITDGHELRYVDSATIRRPDRPRYRNTIYIFQLFVSSSTQHFVICLHSVLGIAILYLFSSICSSAALGFTPFTR